MNKNKPVIDFEMQMGTILRITDALRKQNGHRKSLSDREDSKKNTRKESKMKRKVTEM